jgi:hypothetical protein
MGANRGSKAEAGWMIQSIYGVSAAPKAQRWLERSSRARILNLFPEALNLINDGQTVLSLVVPALGNGPFAIVVDCDEIPNQFEITEQIVIQNNEILIGDVAFQLDAAEVWNPIPDWQSLIQVEKAGLVAEIEGQLRETSSGGGIAEVCYPDENIPGSKFFSAMQAGSNFLLEGLREVNTEKIMTGAETLGGLGVGLTPSGDDYLMGVMYGLWASLRPEVASNTCNLIWAGAAGQTTTLAREWLAAAVAGEAVESWHGLVSAVAEVWEEEIARAIGEILETGETSGADALCGFVQVLKLEFER